jgi:hypothetical protein
MDPLEQRLTDAGEAWRRTQRPAPPIVSLEVPMAERRFRTVFAGRLGALATVGLVALIGTTLLLSQGMGPLRPAAGSPGPAGSPVSGAFPSAVAGFPVVSVADALELLHAGKLDGRAVAVAGYYGSATPSCPYAGRYIGPLERWCGFDALTDTEAGAQLCQAEGANGIACHGPTGAYLDPFFVTETTQPGSWLSSAAAGGPGAPGVPAAVVLIGHAGDPRQWQCLPAMQQACADAFVVDRIAWAAGRDVPFTPPQTGDQITGHVLTPRLSADQVTTALGSGIDIVSGAAVQASQVSAVDPRSNLGGGGLVWVVRTVPHRTSSPGDKTRPETVWLLDDATGKILGSQPLSVEASYEPARVWQTVTLHGTTCCDNDVGAFERVASDAGTVLYEGPVVGGVTGTNDTTTYGGGYGSRPLLVPAGTYSVSLWTGPYSGGVTASPTQSCSGSIVVQPLDVLIVNADFPAGRPCSIERRPPPGPLVEPSQGPTVGTLYPDGIPQTLDNERVYRPTDLFGGGSPSGDFLVGAWDAAPLAVACPIQLAGESPDCPAFEGIAESRTSPWFLQMNLDHAPPPGGPGFVARVHLNPASKCVAIPPGACPGPNVTLLDVLWTADPGEPAASRVTTGGTAWTADCTAASSDDCVGAVELFAINLGRSSEPVFDQSGGQVTLVPRPCPASGPVKAAACWDVTAQTTNGPFCMVVAHRATDPRYPDYFEIGGMDGVGEAGGHPSDWPMCLPST